MGGFDPFRATSTKRPRAKKHHGNRTRDLCGTRKPCCASTASLQTLADPSTAPAGPAVNHQRLLVTRYRKDRKALGVITKSGKAREHQGDWAQAGKRGKPIQNQAESQGP